MKTLRGRPGLGAALAAVRILQGKSRPEVERDARLKPGTLSTYEEGRTTPQPATLERIAAALGVSIPVLIALGDLLAAFHGLLGGAWIAGVIRSAIRLARAVHAALSARVEAIPVAPPCVSLLPAEEERRQAAELWQRLEAYTADQRRAIYQESPRFQRWGLVEILCQKSLDAARDSAQRSLELAEEALFLARLVPEPLRQRRGRLCQHPYRKRHPRGGPTASGPRRVRPGPGPLAGSALRATLRACSTNLASLILRRLCVARSAASPRRLTSLTAPSPPTAAASGRAHPDHPSQDPGRAGQERGGRRHPPAGRGADRRRA